MAELGGTRALNALAVALAGTSLAQIAVPDAAGPLAERDALQLAPAAGIEQAELHLFRMLGIQREVDARAVPRRPQGVRPVPLHQTKVTGSERVLGVEGDGPGPQPGAQCLV